MKPLLIVAAAMCLLGGCRPIVDTEYRVETHGPDGFKQERIDPRLDRYTVYRIDTLNNGKRKDTPLVDIDP